MEAVGPEKAGGRTNESGLPGKSKLSCRWFAFISSLESSTHPARASGVKPGVSAEWMAKNGLLKILTFPVPLFLSAFSCQPFPVSLFLSAVRGELVRMLQPPPESGGG
jgi:hypothetical protein